MQQDAAAAAQELLALRARAADADAAEADAAQMRRELQGAEAQVCGGVRRGVRPRGMGRGREGGLA